MVTTLATVSRLFQEDLKSPDTRKDRLPDWQRVYSGLDATLHGIDFYTSKAPIRAATGYFLHLTIRRGGVVLGLERAANLSVSAASRGSVSYNFDKPRFVTAFYFRAGDVEELREAYEKDKQGEGNFFYDPDLALHHDNFEFRALQDGVVGVVTKQQVGSGFSTVNNARDGLYHRRELRWYTKEADALAAYEATCALLVTNDPEELEMLKTYRVSPPPEF